jgi:glycosyltransferase involved in cell wall biosynthesis
MSLEEPSSGRPVPHQKVTVLTISGHRQSAVTDAKDFQTWRGLADRLGSIRCVWAGPPLRSDEEPMQVLRRPRHAGLRSLFWAASAIRSGVAISRAAIRRGEVLVVNGADPWGWVAAWLVARRVRRPWLMELHDDLLALPAASIGRVRKVALERLVLFLARRATVRRTVCRSMTDDLLRRGVRSDLVPPRLQPIWQVPLDRDRAPLAGPGLTLLVVGRLARQKGYDLLLAAVATLVETMPALRLRIVGDGPERERLGELAATLGITDVVEFLGSGGVDEVRAELARADIFVISSRHEGLPRTLLEATAAGIPVVATAVSGIPYAAAGWASVRLVSPDAASIATGIREVVASPPSAGQLAATRQDVLATYGFEQNLDALVELYRRCATPTAPAGEARSDGREGVRGAPMSRV